MRVKIERRDEEYKCKMNTADWTLLKCRFSWKDNSENIKKYFNLKKIFRDLLSQGEQSFYDRICLQHLPGGCWRQFEMKFSPMASTCAYIMSNKMLSE